MNESTSPYSLSPISSKSQKLLRSPQKATRKISKLPFKVLDAPELADDFYLNLVSRAWINQSNLPWPCVYDPWNNWRGLNFDHRVIIYSKHPWAVVAVQRLEQQPAGLEMGLNPAKYWDFSSLFLSGFPLVKWIVIIQVTPGDAPLRILIFCN